MDAWFDTLAKDSAHRLSRRQVFGRIAGGFGMAVLGVFGLMRRKPDDCARLCEECCKNNYPAGSGDKRYGECVSSCHKGEGQCGPLVCPQ
jgi:hypothetical protein